MKAPFTKRELTRKIRKHVRKHQLETKRRRPSDPGRLVTSRYHQRIKYLIHNTHNFGGNYCWWCSCCANSACCPGIIRPCTGKAAKAMKKHYDHTPRLDQPREVWENLGQRSRRL